MKIKISTLLNWLNTLILIVCFYNSFSQINLNIQEFNKSITNLEHNIWSLKGYIIDTNEINWTVTDPKGYFSFEGIKGSEKANSEGYIIKIKSYFSSPEFFKEFLIINYSYTMHRSERDSSIITESLNCGTETLNSFPVDFKNIKIIFREKTLMLPPSEQIVFQKIQFEEIYYVTLKNGVLIKFRVDPVTRQFNQLN